MVTTVHPKEHAEQDPNVEEAELVDGTVGPTLKATGTRTVTAREKSTKETCGDGEESSPYIVTAFVLEGANSNLEDDDFVENFGKHDVPSQEHEAKGLIAKSLDVAKVSPNLVAFGYKAIRDGR